MMHWRWDGDIERPLQLLPAPIFRPRDVYRVAERMGLPPIEGTRIWLALAKSGRIVRTGYRIHPAGQSLRFYWETSAVDKLR